MYYIYRISSSYNGFIPKIIEDRLTDDNYLIYNWYQYYDQLELNDIVFTYFTGKDIISGVYLISRISEIIGDKKAKGRVIDYSTSTPILTRNNLAKEWNRIFTRPRGSVFVIPPASEPFFDKLLKRQVISEIEILDKFDCLNCIQENDFDFHSCPIFGIENLVNWNLEANLSIPKYKEIVSPFWIIPKQSWWLKISWKEHIISKLFYALKSGYELYTRLFAEAMSIVMETDDRFRNLNFDFIINVPLSPDKKK